MKKNDEKTSELLLKSWPSRKYEELIFMNSCGELICHMRKSYGTHMRNSCAASAPSRRRHFDHLERSGCRAARMTSRRRHSTMPIQVTGVPRRLERLDGKCTTWRLF